MDGDAHSARQSLPEDYQHAHYDEKCVNIHLVQLASRRPTLPSGLGNKSTMIETNMRRHNCVSSMVVSVVVPLSLLICRNRGGVLISILRPLMENNFTLGT